MLPEAFFMALVCAGSAYTGYGKSHVDRRTHTSKEKIAFQEDLSVCDGDHVGRNISGYVSRLCLDNGKRGNGTASRFLAETAGSLQQSGMEINTSPGYASRPGERSRRRERARYATACLERSSYTISTSFPPYMKYFRQRRRRIRGNILERRAVAGCG